MKLLPHGNAENICSSGVIKNKPHSLECGSGCSWRGCSLRSPSLSSSPANRKQTPCYAWFLHSHKPFESKLSAVSSTQKPPFGGVCFLLDRGAGGTKVELFRKGFIESDKSKIEL